MRPHTTAGIGIGWAFSGRLMPGASITTGASTITNCPSEEMPTVEAIRNSRTPQAASAATATLSFSACTTGGGFLTSAGFASFAGATSAVTPLPPTRTLYAPYSVLVRQSTVTSDVVPRCTAAGVTCVTIGNEFWATAAVGCASRVSRAQTGFIATLPRNDPIPNDPLMTKETSLG